MDDSSAFGSLLGNPAGFIMLLVIFSIIRTVLRRGTRSRGSTGRGSGGRSSSTDGSTDAPRSAGTAASASPSSQAAGPDWSSGADSDRFSEEGGRPAADQASSASRGDESGSTTSWSNEFTSSESSGSAGTRRRSFRGGLFGREDPKAPRGGPFG